MEKKLLILGCGGHGKVVADIAEKCAYFKDISFLDKKSLSKYSRYTVFDNKIIGDINEENIEKFSKEYTHFFVGIGDNKVRIQWLKIIKRMNIKITKIIDPSAEISKYSEIDEGTFINKNTVIQCDSKIKSGSILNTSSTIDHDCIIGEGTHISPGVNIAGNVKVGKNCWIGIGSKIVQNIKIGNNVIVGGGSLVLNNIPNDVMVFGSPSKIIKNI